MVEITRPLCGSAATEWCLISDIMYKDLCDLAGGARSEEEEKEEEMEELMDEGELEEELVPELPERQNGEEEHQH